MNRALTPLTVGLVLFLAGAASAQEPKKDKPIPMAYTQDALRVLYKKGLLIPYLKTIHRKGKPPEREYVFHEVLDTGQAGYLIGKRIFDDQGVAKGQPQKPEPIPFRTDAKTFTSADSYSFTKLVIGKMEFMAHQYSYKVQLGRHPGWHTVFYDSKHRGLLL